MVTTPTISSALSTQGNAAQASSVLNQNLDTFLTLLTTQLKNQDPLKPMDSNEFTQQLVQLSSVEQSIQSNKNLENLILLQKASTSANAVGYIGREATVTSATSALQNGSATWRYALTGDAASTTITVKDSSGKVILSKNGATSLGSHDFVWDGKDVAGNKQPDGAYTIEIAAKDADGNAVGTSSSITGVVTGASFAGDDPELVINGIPVKLSDVISVTNPASATP